MAASTLSLLNSILTLRRTSAQAIARRRCPSVWEMGAPAISRNAPEAAAFSSTLRAKACARSTSDSETPFCRKKAIAAAFSENMDATESATCCLRRTIDFKSSERQAYRRARQHCARHGFALSPDKQSNQSGKVRDSGSAPEAA